MVGMEDGPYDARRGVDSSEDALFSEPPVLFFDDDESDIDTDHDLVRSGASAEYETWNLAAEAGLDHDFEDELLPTIGLFDFDDDEPETDDTLLAGTGTPTNNGVVAGLGPAWTDERAATPPVVLHPSPAVDTQWSGSDVTYIPPLLHENAEPEEVEEDEGDFRRSRRFNRVLMVLTVFVLAGVIGGVYLYLNREQTTPTATENPAEQPAEPGEDPSAASGEPTGENPAAPSGNVAALTGPDPVAILTNTGSVRIATTTETEAAAAEYGINTGIGEPRFVGLSESQAFIVDQSGKAWRVDYRNDPTPFVLVDLKTPGATTTYQFLAAEDGTTYFTDSDGNLWSVDATDTPSSVYSPASPDAAVAQLAANATTLYIRTVGGDVYRHDHGDTQTPLAYGPSNENPAIISIAPTATGVVLTAGGGIVRVVDPSKDPPLDVIYKPRGDKGVDAVAAGTGAAILTESGKVVYSVLGSEDVALYTADPAATKPTAAQLVALGSGTIAVVDSEGSLWTLDLTTENPTKIWDAASLGAVASVRPNQDAFAVADAQGNVWSVPTTPGGAAQPLSSFADARAISTTLLASDGATN